MKRKKLRGVEKRKFFRLDVPLTVTMRVVTEEDVPGGITPVQVTSRNISQDGICLETKQIVIDNVNLLSGSPGAREHLIALEIGISQGQEPVRVVGEVCWYDVARDTAEFMYQVGIVFVEFEADGNRILADFLKQYKQTDSLFKRVVDYLKA